MAILLTGATGHLGSFIAVALLRKLGPKLVISYREHRTPEEVLDHLNRTFSMETGLDPESIADRIELLPQSLIPENGRSPSEKVTNLNISEIIHCAGSSSYFDKEALEKVNIQLTQDLLNLGHQLKINRFVYISTAFSSGYSKGLIKEVFHEKTEEDPTEYTKTKRMAEELVANSTIPYLIIRPSIVIGDSQDGHYNGKPFGIYQFMDAFERLFCGEYIPIGHMLAPNLPLNLIHQDAFMEGFDYAHSLLPNGSIIHLVSNQSTLPSIRDLYTLWVDICSRPQEMHYYSNKEDIPTMKLDTRIKMLLEISKVNNAIASRPWLFETKNIDHLKEQGCPFPDATLDSLRTCLQHFVDHSEKIQDFIRRNKSKFPNEIKIIEHPPSHPKSEIDRQKKGATLVG